MFLFANSNEGFNHVDNDEKSNSSLANASHYHVCIGQQSHLIRQNNPLSHHTWRSSGCNGSLTDSGTPSQNNSSPLSRKPFTKIEFYTSTAHFNFCL